MASARVSTQGFFRVLVSLVEEEVFLSGQRREGMPKRKMKKSCWSPEYEAKYGTVGSGQVQVDKYRGT